MNKSKNTLDQPTMTFTARVRNIITNPGVGPFIAPVDSSSVFLHPK